MKTLITKLCVLMMALLIATLQSSSQGVPNSVYYKRLFYLSKAWGHAKYHHTRIAAGLVNWDDELLKTVSSAKNAPTDAAFNDSLLIMLNSAGVMGTSNNTLPDVPDSLNNNNDLSWIQDPFLSDPVRANLDMIRSLFRPQSNVYVDQAFTDGNPTFYYDTLYYSGEDYPSEEKRMLALFRYWNMVHYFFPYKKIMDQNWDTTLVEFIPQIAESSDALSFNLAFKEFSTRINDGHGFYYSPVFGSWRGVYYPPFHVRYIENEMVITQVLPGTTGVTVGDIIKEIDGEDIYELRDSLRKYAYGSNDVSIEKDLNFLIMLGDSGSFQIMVDDGSGTHTTSLIRDSENYNNLLINNNPIWKDTIINGNCTFGIVDMGRLEKTQVDGMFADLWDTDAIIFDLRNYPNGTLWTIVNYLFPSPINIANFTVPDNTYPGRLYWNSETNGSGTSNPYNGKVIILFDERTQSQAEYTCMGLEQFPGAIKIGSTTAGADGNVSREYLTGNINTRFTGLGTYYPDYTPTQRVGIIPDFEVHPTIAGIRAGQDEVLEFALDCSLLVTDYCTSSGNNASTDWIQKVILGTYINNSGYNIGYGDFTAYPITIESGQTYDLNITPGFSGKSRREYCRVWIDYNMDGDFTDAGEQVFAYNRMKAAVNGSIIIPVGLSGETRMRVSMKYASAPSSCENFAYGEVEDYTLNIITPVPQPPVADFTGSPTEISIGQSVQFTDLSSNNPTSWSWTFAGGTPEISSAQNPVITYDIAGTYGVTLIVSNETGSDTLIVPEYISVTEGGIISYCPSQSNSNALEWIGEVAIASFTNSSGASLYSDFTAMTIQLEPGSSNAVTLTPHFTNKSQREFWRIWIDFNADGDFADAGEKVFAANNKKTVVTGTMSIPSSASEQTRMRISMKNGSAPSPCEIFNRGEVEDYTVSFISGLRNIPVVSEPGIRIYPVPSKDLLNLDIQGYTSTVEVRIYNTMGSLMETLSLETGLTQINLNTYPKGLYFIHFTDGDNMIPKKFIKQ